MIDYDYEAQFTDGVQVKQGSGTYYSKAFVNANTIRIETGVPGEPDVVFGPWTRILDPYKDRHAYYCSEKTKWTYTCGGAGIDECLGGHSWVHGSLNQYLTPVLLSWRDMPNDRNKCVELLCVRGHELRRGYFFYHRKSSLLYFRVTCDRAPGCRDEMYVACFHIAREQNTELTDLWLALE